MHLKTLAAESSVVHLANLGMSQMAIAANLGLSARTISLLAKRNGIEFRKRGKSFGPQDKARFSRMQELRASGKTLQQIGDEFGLTRQRVSQIL